MFACVMSAIAGSGITFLLFGRYHRYYITRVLEVSKKQAHQAYLNGLRKGTHNATQMYRGILDQQLRHGLGGIDPR